MFTKKQLALIQLQRKGVDHGQTQSEESEGGIDLAQNLIARQTTKEFVTDFVKFRVSSKFEHKLLNGIIHRNPGKFLSK